MAEKGIIACGIGYNYVMENFPEGCPYPLLKISQYPLPVEKIAALAASCREILVVEDGQPFVEEQLKGILPSAYQVKGRLSEIFPYRRVESGQCSAGFGDVCYTSLCSS